MYLFEEFNYLLSQQEVEIIFKIGKSRNTSKAYYHQLLKILKVVNSGSLAVRESVEAFLYT